MKSRETLIRLRKFQVDEKRRRVAQIESMVADFDRMATDLEREIETEQSRAGITDPTHFAYPTYAKAALVRRDNLKRSADELKGQLEDARMALAEAFEELKKVELLDDFASRGWTSYGRCERGSAGGWATAEALYAVVPSYAEGLDSEAFRVVFLGHETQHFADQNAFPGIAPWELEYRAKLVELIEAREVSAKRLGYMMTAQGDDTASPHTYANKRVANDLTARLGEAPDKVSIERLQQASRELLVEDTARRKAAPPAAVAR